MAQEDRYQRRPMEYSAWHRIGSVQRFVGLEKAKLLSMVDVDTTLYVEYVDGTKMPLVLLEVAQDVGQEYKSASVLTNLARLAGLPAYVVLYTWADTPNPAMPDWFDIAAVRARQLTPQFWRDWRYFTPHAWAEFLLALRVQEAKRHDSRLAHAQHTPASALGRCGECNRMRPITDLTYPSICSECREKAGPRR